MTEIIFGQSARVDQAELEHLSKHWLLHEEDLASDPEPRILGNFRAAEGETPVPCTEHTSLQVFETSSPQKEVHSQLEESALIGHGRHKTTSGGTC